MPVIRPTSRRVVQGGDLHVWARSEEGECRAENGRTMLVVTQKVLLTEWSSYEGAFLVVGWYLRQLNCGKGEGWETLFKHEAPPYREKRVMRGFYMECEMPQLGYDLIGTVSGQLDTSDFTAVRRILRHVYRHIFSPYT